VPRLCLRHVVQSMTSSVADGLEAPLPKLPLATIT
jgi:hypothetical protein